DDDAGNGVGHSHQRRVQRRRHAPHHIIADEDGQHEDGQAEDGGIDVFHHKTFRSSRWSMLNKTRSTPDSTRGVSSDQAARSQSRSTGCALGHPGWKIGTYMVAMARKMPTAT